MEQIEIVEEYPARLADMLLNDEVDVGLVPVATLLRMEDWYLVGDYCIGCDGEVASVCIFSEVPMEEVKHLYLDYQSRTSARLAQILVKEYWRISPEIIHASGEDFREKIGGDTAALVIGDRALEQRNQSTYVYDLGEAWKEYTGLPFVFAAWVSKKPLPAAFVADFNEANRLGVEKTADIATSLEYPGYDLVSYFKKNIRFQLDDRAKEGLRLFLAKEI